MRCLLAGRALASVVGDFPDIEVHKLSFLANRALAKQAGVKSVPSLVYGEKRLTGVLLTKEKIRRFLESL